MGLGELLVLVTMLATSSSSGPYLGQAPPGTTPVRFDVAGIAPDRSVPVFAPDRVEVYWAQPDEVDRLRRIRRAYLSARGWSEPALAPFADRWDADNPVFSPDGQRLYFNSTRPLAADGGHRRERFWFLVREPGGWSVPHALGPEINGDHVHWRCSVDTDGNVYFGSERDSGQGGNDIYVSRRTSGGHQPALAMAPPINTSCHETTPFVAADGSYLLFARSCFGADSPDVPTGLLASFRRSDGTWSEPAPVPLAGGAAEHAACPTVTHDGRFLFFLVLDGDRRSVYWVDAAVVWNLDPRQGS